MPTTKPAESQARPSSMPSPLHHLLKSYTSSHPLRLPSPLPANARVDPQRPQRSAPPSSSSPLMWTLGVWIAFIQFALAKGLHIVWSLLKHLIVGPHRKSWGYRMTFIVSFMRNVANYTDFADIVLVRRLVSITYLIPLPADAVVTPITFLVPKRRGEDTCRGFFRDWDCQETGTRELTGEWVVNNDVWKRLKAERRAKWNAEMRRRARNPVGPSRLRHDSMSSDNSETRSSPPRRIFSSLPTPIYGRTPAISPRLLPRGPEAMEMPEPEVEGVPPSRRERVIYYVHGGAYYVGNAATHRLITVGVSKACNARVFAITYRLAPEATFPLPLHDVLHGYLRLLAPPLSIPPENIVVMGDSAGGGLSLALCMYLRDHGYQLPAGLVLMSPWVDLTMSCGSWDENAYTDVVPRPDAEDHLNPVGCYLGPKGLQTYLTHPYASPLFGDLRGLPPMLIQSGEAEVLRDENTLLAHKASLAGVHVTHELYEDMVHVFQTFTWLAAAKAAVNSVGRWVRQTLPRVEWEAAQAAQAVEAAQTLLQREIEAGTDSDADPLDSDNDTEGDDTPMATSPARRERPSGGSSRRGHEDGHGSASSDHSTPRRQRSTANFWPDVSVIPPTGPRQQRPTTVFPNQPHVTNETVSHRPQLRRAHTASISSSAYPSASAAALSREASHMSLGRAHSQSHISQAARDQASIRRRRAAASLSMHISTPVSPTEAFASGPMYPASPPPQTPRRRLRAPTITSYPTTPTARTRSTSHTDIFELLDSYRESGAANPTVVYGAEGEIRSVGVLGDDEDEWGVPEETDQR
ncbi:hypothetical protein CspeluHIS016_0404080 [Cutaneotrichosporon spelunceum]|uniref:Alpha/beta hydrolase fold-3 domain-containing protein n=1 Tax=Cutaneotrichosporon spelunceum TaxID=1672016 RepID=A0AAD3TW49_9TREE|nr:hypothetical protein CspeluHIS016_0404080 [Cutaneotrichosporon spelunceum]